MPARPQDPAFSGKTVTPQETVMQTVILDGIWGWHSRWEPLRRGIEAGVGPCQIWHYDSSGWVSIETLGARLAADLCALDGPFCAVGYSMGGLIVREALRQDPSLQLRSAALLNTPHGGSLVAHLLPFSACRDMRPHSPFLRRLNETPWEYPTLATWCPADLMVVPGYSARWHRATRIIRSDMPIHEWPVVSPGIRREIVAFFSSAKASPEARSPESR
jgi:pimeloyl-ACP methyl ester carboxylesterase